MAVAVNSSKPVAPKESKPKKADAPKESKSEKKK